MELGGGGDVGRDAKCAVRGCCLLLALSTLGAAGRPFSLKALILLAAGERESAAETQTSHAPCTIVDMLQASTFQQALPRAHREPTKAHREHTARPPKAHRDHTTKAHHEPTASPPRAHREPTASPPKTHQRPATKPKAQQKPTKTIKNPTKAHQKLTKSQPKGNRKPTKNSPKAHQKPTASPP